MFENYVHAKTAKRPRWVYVLIITSLVLHGVAAGALIIKQFWEISLLPLPEGATEISLGAPPPPPPPPGGKRKKKEKKVEKKKKKVKETVQPVKDEEPPPEEEQADDSIEDEDFGVEGGVEGGVAGGVLGGTIGGTLGGTNLGAPPPPPEPEKPTVVPQAVTEQNRIGGEQNVQPPLSVKQQMVKQGETQVRAAAKICISKAGTIKSVRLIKSSGYDDYDRLLQQKIRGWRYSPFKVNGKAAEVCTSVTFIYRQS